MNVDQDARPKFFMGDPTFRMGFLAALETLLNRTLSLDPVTLKKLGELQGKAVSFHCLEPAFQCYVLFESQGIRLADWQEGDVDASLSGSSIAFLELASHRRVPFGEITGLETSGSEELLSRLESIHADMDLDWEALFCRVLGDVGGHAAAEGVRSIVARLGLLRDTATRNLGGYLQEELQLLPSTAEVRGFANELAALRENLKRLEERVARLGQQNQQYRKTGE
ncbi:MAG: ubiquinone biosynthesis accessory factor UbiJ [Endozoicomonas sp.]